MAIKRKTAASRPKAKPRPRSEPAKKAQRSGGSKATGGKAAAAGRKPAKPVKAAKPAKPVKETKPAKPAAKPVKPAAKPGKLKAVPGQRPAPAPVRPIGALPPAAVARAVKAAPVPLPRPAKPAPRPQPVTTPDPGAQGVSEKDYQEFERRLLEERRKILKEMGHLESTVLKVNQRDSAGDLSGYSFHMADVGTDAMEREKAFLFASTEGQLLREIDVALRKIYGGEYGSCENCGRPIARARLEAMPSARLCMPCKESEERSGRGPA